MLTSSPIDTPNLPRTIKPKHKPTIATPQTSHTLNKSHRLLRPLKSKLLSLQQFHESTPSLTRVESIWSPTLWPPSTRIAAKSYGGRRKRTRGNLEDDSTRAIWEDMQINDVDALKNAKNSTMSVSIANMFTTLHSSYRIFLQQLHSGSELGGLTEIATYTLGTWTYLYERQSSLQNTETPSDDPVLTLDDVLLEYLPPTHPHLPLLLGYTIALFNDYVDFIRPLLPSLILLTNTVSRRATLELIHCMFSTAGSGWEDFSLCMMISQLIGRDDEYLLWLSRNMTPQFIMDGGLGHLLRLTRDYPSFSATIVRAVSLCVPQKRTPLDSDLESVLSELIQLVCTYSLQSNSTKDLIQLTYILPSQRTPLPSLSLLIHLTIKTNLPDYPDTNLIPLLKRDLKFDILRHVIPPSTLKSHISSLLVSSHLSTLAIAMTRDWKDHINYDDDEEPDHLESTQEFLDRIEREYLTETEGVKWRFEDVLEEWIGEWPDGRELESTRVPKVRRYVPVDDEEEEEDEEFGGSLVKRYIPRSGLVFETPVQSRGLDFMSERKGVLERLFKLTGIGQSAKGARTASAAVAEDDGGSFLERLGQNGKRLTDIENGRANSRHNGRTSKRRAVSDEETSIYKDSDSDERVVNNVKRKRRKRRRFDDNDDDSEDSVYENHYDDSDVENHSMQSDPDLEEPSTSDIDELSISIEAPRPALKGIQINRKAHRTSSHRNSANKILVRESSPVLFDDASDDELAI